MGARAASRAIAVSGIAVAACVVASAGAAAFACVGDCDGDGRVQVDELVRAVNCVYGGVPLSEEECGACLDTDDPEPDDVSIGLDKALNDCAPGFDLSVYLQEFPHSGAHQRGGTLYLEPLHRSVYQDLFLGEFRFREVRPGDYTLRYGSSCNPFGCWPQRTAVEVVDRTVYVDIPIYATCAGSADCGQDECCIDAGGFCGCTYSCGGGASSCP